LSTIQTHKNTRPALFLADCSLWPANPADHLGEPCLSPARLSLVLLTEHHMP